jgi:hypothetical protein
LAKEAAEILASALEADADAQERGELDGIAMRYDDVLGELLPYDEFSEPPFSLAMIFWDEWGYAVQHKWITPLPFEESDWPRLAREIAAHLRSGTLPEDEAMLEHFMSTERTGCMTPLGCAKRLIRVAILSVLVVTVLLGIWWAVPLHDTWRSVTLWNEFRAAMANGNAVEIRRLLADDDEDIHEIREDGVYYSGTLFNATIIDKRPDFRRTFQYYLWDKPEDGPDKVVLVNGYALIEKGRIIFLKFP